MPLSGPEQLPGEAAGDLVALIRRTAATAGDTPAFTFVEYAKDRRGIPSTLSYRQLDARARAVADAVLRHCAPGDRAAVLAPQGLDYLVGFLGCLYAGVIAVPLYAPEAYRSNERLQGVLRDSAPACLLTAADSADAVREVGRTDSGAELPVVRLDELPQTPVGPAGHPPVRPEAPAYLQYTSGSTSTPRGVVVSHENLLAAARQSSVRSQLVAEDVVVSWLPYFHDLGLITGVAMPLSVGAHAVHLSPTAFVQRPHRWLELVSRYRGTWTAAPNFALDLCVRRVTAEQRADLRLDSLHTLCNGSEQVRPQSVLAFTEAFAPCGFTLNGHAPGYGLAEATLGVTTAPDGAVIRSFDRDAVARGTAVPCDPDAPRAWGLVGCGTPLPGLQVAVADPGTGHEVPDGTVGEIWVSGPNVAAGYWRRPQETAEVFGAVLTTRDGWTTGPVWLRTGDLGFLREKELFLTGRRKDLVIIDGRNHYPGDVEATVTDALAALEPAVVAAFAAPGNDGERLVIAVELRRRGRTRPDLTRDEAVTAVRRAVTVHHGVDAAEVLFVRPGALPKTSSGKIRRRSCATAFAESSLHRDDTEW
ncbi:fatty acyl-AMP ligase [Streptomyces bambusae]|uniref:AMP-binding protein n=1 Tax=Streptomyces bambusae TaxID=1550616 RepID=A0ABS6YY68_9ACTN|nr:fatty acyl-AMP ligase [Streptomyces bambusae]MBW5480397.1 AMP-binding protein [Streptomyces bambusae]